MLPHDAEMLMAKVLLIVFATFALCYAKANGAEFNQTKFQKTVINLEIQA